MKLVMLTNTPTTNTILLNYHLMNIFQLRLGQLVLCWVFLFHLFQKRWVFWDQVFLPPNHWVRALKGTYSPNFDQQTNCALFYLSFIDSSYFY